MKSIRKLEWLYLTDTSLILVDYLNLKYRKCNWYVEKKESKFVDLLRKRDRFKNIRTIKIFDKF